jgi:hypothetical protein
MTEERSVPEGGSSGTPAGARARRFVPWLALGLLATVAVVGTLVVRAHRHRPRWTFRSSISTVYDVHFADHGQIFAVLSDDRRRLELWSLESDEPRLLRDLDLEEDEWLHEFHPLRDRFLTRKVGLVRVRSARTGEVLSSLEVPEGIPSHFHLAGVALSPTAGEIAVLTTAGIAYRSVQGALLASLDPPHPPEPYEPEEGHVSAFGFEGNGTKLSASIVYQKHGSGPGDVATYDWSLETRKLVEPDRKRSEEGTRLIGLNDLVSDDGAHCLDASERAEGRFSVRTWNPQGREEDDKTLATIELSRKIGVPDLRSAISAEGDRVAIGSHDGLFEVWQIPR